MHEVRTPLRGNVLVNAAHTRHLVAHPLGLQDVPDVEVVHHGLVGVPLAVLGQAGDERQPAGQRGRVSRRLLGSGAPFVAAAVADQQAVLAELGGAGADGTAAEAVLGDYAAMPRPVGGSYGSPGMAGGQGDSGTPGKGAEASTSTGMAGWASLPSRAGKVPSAAGRTMRAP
jgi:hypothetical protein